MAHIHTFGETYLLVTDTFSETYLPGTDTFFFSAATATKWRHLLANRLNIYLQNVLWSRTRFANE